jgi:hypothetical protein
MDLSLVHARPFRTRQHSFSVIGVFARRGDRPGRPYINPCPLGEGVGEGATAR